MSDLFGNDRLRETVSGNDRLREMTMLDALVTGHEDMFRTSPEFHAAATLLSRTLPRFMDLMAEEARDAEVLRKRLIDNLNTQQTGPEL